MDETPTEPAGTPWPGYPPPGPGYQPPGPGYVPPAPGYQASGPGYLPPGSAPPPPRHPRRLWRLAAGVAAVTGVGVGAAALAAATTGPSTSPDAAAGSTTASSGTTTTTPSGSSSSPAPPANGSSPVLPGMRGPRRFGFFGGPGAGLGLGGQVVHGEYTIKGQNGYETIDERTGTVSSVTDTSGSTWTLEVKSADGTTGTFTVDSGTSVNGGEMGIGSVKTGDTVRVTAVVSGGTSTAKDVVDQTVLQSNGKGWRSFAPMPGPMGGPAAGNTGTGNSGSTQTG
jgi:hypothetical protein